MAERAPEVLIVAVSARALAESAAAAGYRVSAVDGYGDLDLRARARALSLRRDLGVPYSARAAVAAAGRFGCPVVAYASNLENHPRELRRLMAGRALWGNPPEVVARVRDPLGLARALGRRGLAVPRVAAAAAAADRRLEWLVKPRRSGGGHGIAAWRPAAPLPRGCYLQERIDGIPGSIVFAADGRTAVPLGVSRQLVGEADFGAAGYRYSGSLLAGGPVPLFDREADLVRAAIALAEAVVEEFRLVGVSGVDFVARDGVPYPVEVNPRYSASMELVELAHGISVFDLHARGSRSPGGLSAVSSPIGKPLRGVIGKAVVFARAAGRAGDLRRWWREGVVRDVPHPGEAIAPGRPICTVFAEADDPAACREALARRAAGIYRAVEPGTRSVA